MAQDTDLRYESNLKKSKLINTKNKIVFFVVKIMLKENLSVYGNVTVVGERWQVAPGLLPLTLPLLQKVLSED
jgi:hypothetical protein